MVDEEIRKQKISRKIRKMDLLKQRIQINLYIDILWYTCIINIYICIYIIH